MSPNEREKTTSELADLYTRHGEQDDIEPEAGLDRLIRARAEAAVEDSRSRRALPWIGGLATASVAIVAIAVVLQQSPTGERAESDVAIDAFSRQATESNDSVEPAAQAPLAEISRRARSAEQDLAGSPPVGFSERKSLAADRSLPELTEAAEDRTDADPAEALAVDNPERWLASIRQLVERGDIDKARRQLDRLQRAYPDFPLPEDIRSLRSSGDPDAVGNWDASDGGTDPGNR